MWRYPLIFQNERKAFNGILYVFLIAMVSFRSSGRRLTDRHPFDSKGKSRQDSL